MPSRLENKINFHNAEKPHSSGIRIFFKIIFTILLTMALILFIIDLSFMQTTSYNNLEPRITIFTEQTFSNSLEQSTPEDLSLLKTELIENCSGQKETQFSLGEQGFMPLGYITLDCSSISNETTTEQLMNIISTGFFDSIYYKEYDCSPLACISQADQDPSKLLVILSKKANTYFTNIGIILIALIIIFITSIILLSKPKQTAIYSFVPALLVSGLLFLVKFPLSSQILGIPRPINSILELFISALFINAIIVFILGIIFLALSIILKISIKKSKKL